MWKDLPFLDRLAEAVTLEEARGSGGRTSLRTMLELLARDGAVLCATRPYPDLEPSPEGPPVCVVKDPALAAHLFDGRARYVDEDLAERQRLHEVQVRWRARALAHLPETPGATATVTWQGPGMRVECRILTPGPSTSLMHLVKDGCRVVDRDLCLALNGAEVLLEAPLTTTRDLDDVVRDERYAEALLALADGLPSLLAALARLAPSSPAHRIRDRVARAWSLLLTEDPGFLILRSAGFERDQAWQLVEQRRGRLAVAWSGPAIEPLVQVPLFRTWNVGLVSLAQVRQQAEEDGKVWFAAVAPPHKNPSGNVGFG